MSNGPPSGITGFWLHSQEEDTASTTVYRRRGYSFPPSRGRDALELRPDGTCVGYDSGPDDRGRQLTYRWEDDDGPPFGITVQHGDGGSSTRRILSWTPDVLVLEKH